VIPIRVRYLILLGSLVFVCIVAAGQVRASDDSAPAAATQKPLTCKQVDACRRAVAWQRHRHDKLVRALAWQKRQARKQRLASNREHAASINDFTRDAIHWAAEKYGGAQAASLERRMLGIGLCESHLWPWATNGQYLSWAQLSGRHRSDPVIARLTWRDPYAVADHVARYILRYGGGLRW
jgi:hypothetical protein